MKKKLAKLTFTKQTVRNLSNEDLNQVDGGSLWTSNPRIPSSGVINTVTPGGGGGCEGSLVP
jgi:hypothetical protein